MIYHALFLDVLTSRSKTSVRPIAKPGFAGSLKTPISALMDMSAHGVVVSKNRLHDFFLEILTGHHSSGFL
jgi:hypothetical protein